MKKTKLKKQLDFIPINGVRKSIKKITHGNNIFEYI